MPPSVFIPRNYRVLLIKLGNLPSCLKVIYAAYQSFLYSAWQNSLIFSSLSSFDLKKFKKWSIDRLVKLNIVILLVRQFYKVHGPRSIVDFARQVC